MLLEDLFSNRYANARNSFFKYYLSFRLLFRRAPFITTNVYSVQHKETSRMKNYEKKAKSVSQAITENEIRSKGHFSIWAILLLNSFFTIFNHVFLYSSFASDFEKSWKKKWWLKISLVAKGIFLPYRKYKNCPNATIEWQFRNYGQLKTSISRGTSGYFVWRTKCNHSTRNKQGSDDLQSKTVFFFFFLFSFIFSRVNVCSYPRKIVRRVFSDF